MIYAHLNHSVPRSIIGYECGNRHGFDQRHGGDPDWVFLDQVTVEHRIDHDAFIKDCTQFYIDAHGLIQKHYIPTPPSITNYVYITDPDGAILTDDQGAYLIEQA